MWPLECDPLNGRLNSVEFTNIPVIADLQIVKSNHSLVVQFSMTILNVCYFKKAFSVNSVSK